MLIKTTRRKSKKIDYYKRSELAVCKLRLIIHLTILVIVIDLSTICLAVCIDVNELCLFPLCAKGSLINNRTRVSVLSVTETHDLLSSYRRFYYH